MPKRKKLQPFTYAKHKIMGVRLQLCYNFLQSFYGTMEKSYGRNSKQCKALWRAITQLDEVKNQMDSRVVAENPAPPRLSARENHLHYQDLFSIYYANHKVNAQGQTLLDLAAHKE